MASRKAEFAVDRLVNDRVLTPAGRDWLIAALDPFHDTDLSVRGYPDTNIAPSVVQCIKQSVTITSPQSTPTTNWNAHVFTLPLLQQARTAWYYQLYNGLFAEESQNTINLLNLSSDYVGSGSGGTNLGLPNATSILGLDNYDSDSCRIVACGFEIVNNTAEIYKQGQITAYRMPQPTADSTRTYQYLTGDSPYNVVGSGSFRQLSCPPSTTAQAMLLSGSRQWAAAEGAYSVVSFSSPELPVFQDLVSGAIFSQDPTSTRIIGTQFQSVVTDSPVYAPQPIGPSQNQHTSGVFLTGLSAQTSLTVTLNVWLEVFPQSSNAALTVLATPSPRYDLVAQEIYSEALADMPVSVMVKENGLGDWFKSAVSKVSSWAQPVLSAIPHPAAQGASMILGGADRMLNRNAYQMPPDSKVQSIDQQLILPLASQSAKAARRARKRARRLAATPGRF